MSDIINLLPDSVANQIAAGEVIQRPASAVKELMENAIDAGADHVQVIITNAGKTLIQVIDNGCGMSIKDATSCFQRHATSKIKTAEDLFSIRTMGFRGEAMASIAAIAQLTLKTRRHEDELGTSIQLAGSKILKQEPEMLSAGTNIQVKNLFYNIPARRNFLKSNPVEMRHIIDEFQRQAIAHPSVFFSLHSEDRELFHLPATGLKQRIIHVFGNSYKQRLVPIEEQTSIASVKGFVGKPEFAKKTRGDQYFFVNQRFVKDPYLNHAVMNAFNELLAPDTYPFYVLFIDIDPAHIDINVHPTKTEIKYQDDRSVYAIIRSAVKRSLGKYNITPSLDFDQETSFDQMITPKPLNEIVPPSIRFNPDFNPFDNAQSTSNGRNKPSEEGRQRQQLKDWESLYSIRTDESVNQLTLHQDSDAEVENGSSPVRERAVIFQLHNRLIVSQIRSGFVIIDQQAAHERVLFERFYKQLQERQGTSQQSLFPQTLELSVADCTMLEALLPELQNLGFQIRPFGKTTYVVDGVPADIGASHKETQIIESLLEAYKLNQQTNLKDRELLAKNLARSTSIKSGAVLDIEAMVTLIDQLFACQFPNTSLSGKPTFLTYTLKDLLDKFGKKE